MRGLRIPLDAIDMIALAGLVMLAIGVAALTVPAAALVVLGSAFLLYAVLVTRSAP